MRSESAKKKDSCFETQWQERLHIHSVSKHWFLPMNCVSSILMQHDLLINLYMQTEWAKTQVLSTATSEIYWFLLRIFISFCMACVLRNDDFWTKQGPEITPHGCLWNNGLINHGLPLWFIGSMIATEWWWIVLDNHQIFIDILVVVIYLWFLNNGWLRLYSESHVVVCG